MTDINPEQLLNHIEYEVTFTHGFHEPNLGVYIIKSVHEEVTFNIRSRYFSFVDWVGRYRIEFQDGIFTEIDIANYNCRTIEENSRSWFKAIEDSDRLINIIMSHLPDSKLDEQIKKIRQ